jgi:hypothetical protein
MWKQAEVAKYFSFLPLGSRTSTLQSAPELWGEVALTPQQCRLPLQ